MNKFLTIGMIIVIMSLLSCTAGPIGVLAAAILPLFAIIGVGLMTLNVLVANGQNQIEGDNDPAVVLGNFMDLMLVYTAKCLRGLFFGIGKMIGWGMPNMIGEGAEPQPPQAPDCPPAGLAAQKRAGQSGVAAVKIKVHIYLHKHDKPRNKHGKRVVPVVKVCGSRCATV